MELEKLLKNIIEMVQEEGANNIEGYNLLGDKGVEFKLNGKKFDIRIMEK